MNVRIIATSVVSMLQRVVSMLQDHQAAINEGYYTVLVHPRTWADIRALAARESWRAAWRAYRLARRDSLVSELSPREIAVRFATRELDAETGRFVGLFAAALIVWVIA